MTLVLHTVAARQPGEPLEFGLWQLAHRAGATLDRGAFHADDLSTDEVADFHALCRAEGWPQPVSRRAFLQSALYRNVYKLELPLAAWFLPADLGRLAADWAQADAGGFSLIIWTLPQQAERSTASARRRPMLANGQVENGYRPRIVIVMLDGQRPLIEFTRTAKPDELDLIPEGGRGVADRGYVKRGRFHTLALHASSLAGERLDSLADACRTFGVELPTARSGDDLAERFQQACLELRATVSLNRRLLDEHERVAGGLCAPDAVYSAVSYGRTRLRAAMIEPPLARNPESPRSALAAGIGGFFGGECAVTIRATKEPLPCLFLDYRSVYPVVARLQHADRVLKAERLVVNEEDAQEILTWLTNVSLDDLLDPRLHVQVALRFVELTPDGQWLPHRIPAGRHWKGQFAPLQSNQPLWYPLPDVLRALQRGGPTPRIARAFRVEAVGRQRGLRQTRLPSGRFVRASDDLVYALARERLGGGSWRGAKACANGCASGLFAQINDRDVPGRRTLQHVWHPDGRQHAERGTIVEEPGPWYYPPLAASITAGGRLLLHLVVGLVERAGGTVAYRDTDSVAVVAAPNGGLVACPGGSHRDGEGREAVVALSFADVEAIRERVESLNPDRVFDGDKALPLLRIEQDNLDSDGRLVQAYLHARSTKNYDRYRLTNGSKDGPDLTLTKRSEHGLGHLQPHWDTTNGGGDWIGEGRDYLLKIDLGLRTSPPRWFSEVALSVVRVTAPSELKRLNGSNTCQARAAGARPFSRIAVAHTDPLYRDEHGERLVPVAPWHDNLTPQMADWHSIRDGRPLAIRPAPDRYRESDLAPGGRVPVQTMRDVFNRIAQRHDHALDQHRRRVTATTSGVITPAPTRAVSVQTIGRETTDSDRVGITNDPSYRVYTDPDNDDWRAARDTIRILARGSIRPGRPREEDKPQLIRRAAELARRELKRSGVTDLPSDPAITCRVYLELIGRGRAVCDGCGRRLGKRERRWCATCRDQRRTLASRG